MVVPQARQGRLVPLVLLQVARFRALAFGLLSLGKLARRGARALVQQSHGVVLAFPHLGARLEAARRQRLEALSRVPGLCQLLPVVYLVAALAIQVLPLVCPFS